MIKYIHLYYRFLRLGIYKRKIIKIREDVQLLIHIADNLPESLYKDVISLIDSDATIFIDSNLLKSYRNTYKIQSSIVDIIKYAKNNKKSDNDYKSVLIGLTLFYGHDYKLITELYLLRQHTSKQRVPTK